MESEESFLETLARYSFPIPLLIGGSSRRSASVGKKETIEKLTVANKKLKLDNAHLENEVRSAKEKVAKDNQIEARYHSLLEAVKKLNPKLPVDKEV